MRFAYDYSQLYLYEAAQDLASADNPYLDALDAATHAGLTVGAASGIVDVLMPRQENFSATIDVAIIDTPPPVAEAAADHVVEFDLTSSGRLTLEGSGGAGALTVDVPPGQYRARLSGFDFDAAERWSYDHEGHPGDHYRLELWLSEVPQPPAELRRWPGYADRL